MVCQVVAFVERGQICQVSICKKWCPRYKFTNRQAGFQTIGVPVQGKADRGWRVDRRAGEPG